MNSKNFLCLDKSGKQRWYRVRQVVGHDKIYKIGDRIPGLGYILLID